MSGNALLPAGAVDRPVVVFHAGTILPARYRKHSAVTDRPPGPQIFAGGSHARAGLLSV
jgi:hypothetical protein